MTAGPRAPGVAPRVNQPTPHGPGTSISPLSSRPSGTSRDRTPILGMDTLTGSDSGRTGPVVLSRRLSESAGADERAGVGGGSAVADAGGRRLDGGPAGGG